ncbi:flagellar biosynthesis repressor FlbT [Bradyrhizobium sp. Tv2a-2]|uniref:flagellar biosynthesis repressor FlbT n=1 Tax=Bradyrhizobium sp. Tv2a-2 TaxID=113395 RepID=UPI0004117558|nr:flagellar biosynthesis repressor FlbT [Bradyrhizobium sp. Tv2a-2]
MPLRVELKPFERIVIGQSVIINSASRTCFLVDGEVPILREQDTITAETADTTAKRLYLCVQTMYLKNDPEPNRTACLGLLDELVREIPDCRDVIAVVAELVSKGLLYKALKEIRKLIKRAPEPSMV